MFLFFSAVSCILLDLLIYADKPAGTERKKSVVIVRYGQRFSTTLENLQQIDIIKNPFKFKLLAYIKGYDKRLKAGEYLLSSSMSPGKILEVMVTGKVQLHRLTVPEGYSLYQVASIVEKAGFGSKQDFLKAATDDTLLRELGIEAKTFEGYLFPDTYYFRKGEAPEKIISAMVKRFRAVWNPAWEKQADTLGFSIHQVVTLASIIEKETGAQFERPIISSVFHNRLKKRMRLESDPTVIYGIKNFNGNITKKHLKTATPYNTYKKRGLPLGPIAGPGIKALEAALYPADTRFLYFVSKKDSTHKFSTNIKDHNRAVRKYQLRRR